LGPKTLKPFSDYHKTTNTQTLSIQWKVIAKKGCLFAGDITQNSRKQQKNLVSRACMRG